MKKLIFLVAGLAGLSNLFSQEIVVGGNMEDESVWLTASPMGATDETTFDFAYTNQKPTLGTGGCLAVTGIGQTRALAWQEVTLTPGHSYVFSGLIKNASADSVFNTWAEVLLSRKTPNPDEDFGVVNGDYIFARNSWSTAPWNNFTNIDGELIDEFPFSWKNGSTIGGDSTLLTNTIFVPDSVSVTTWYIGIKAGIWNEVAGEPEFTYLFDNISLWDTAEDLPSAIQERNSDNHLLVSVFPNPATNASLITYETPESGNVQFEIYNSTGQKVITLINEFKVQGVYETSLDAINQPSGIYFYTLKVNNKFTSGKFQLL